MLTRSATFPIISLVLALFCTCNYESQISWEAVCEGLIKCDEEYIGLSIEDCVASFNLMSEKLRSSYLDAYKRCILDGDCFYDMSLYCRNEAMSSVPEESIDWFVDDWCKIADLCDQQTTYELCYKDISSSKDIILPFNDLSLMCLIDCLDSLSCVQFLEDKYQCYTNCGIYLDL